MQAKENALLLTPGHRATMMTLIVVELVGFIWGMTLYVNYAAFSIPFLNYSSVITAESTKTHYFRNGCLLAFFWVQHILMATLKYKTTIAKRMKYFVLYQRYIFNISSALTMWFIYYNLKPSYVYLFTVPKWICIPCSIVALLMLTKALLEVGGKMFLPFKINDISKAKYLAYDSFEAKAMAGLKMDGIYGYVRQPIQAGLLGIMIFMNGVYTTDKLLHLAIMGGGILIGVLMEEQRMLVMYKDYKHYMETVKARFVPFMRMFKL